MEYTFSDAWTAYENEKYDEAKTIWKVILDNDSSDEVRSGYCYTLCSLEEFGEAREIYLDLWDKTNDHKHLHQLCMVEREAQNYDRAMEYIKREANLINESDTLALAANLYEQAKISELMGNINDSLVIAKNCDDISKECDDLIMKACSKRLLGEIYSQLENDKSTEYYISALAYFSKAQDKYGLKDLLSKTNEISLCNPTMSDVKDLYNIELENYGEEESTELTTFEDIVEYINSPQNAGDYILKKISLNKNLTGFYCAIIEESTANFVDIAVTKDWQGKGLGAILLFHFLSELPSNIEEIRLEVRKTNKAATTLYKNFGFSEGQILENYYEDGGDAVVMKKNDLN